MNWIRKHFGGKKIAQSTNAQHPYQITQPILSMDQIWAGDKLGHVKSKILVVNNADCQQNSQWLYDKLWKIYFFANSVFFSYLISFISIVGCRCLFECVLAGVGACYVSTVSAMKNGILKHSWSTVQFLHEYM